MGADASPTGLHLIGAHSVVVSCVRGPQAQARPVSFVLVYMGGEPPNETLA